MLRPLERVARSTRAIPRAVGSGDGLGSNGWVVAGSHTTTGNPLLANDPHLDVGQPGVFYQMGLHCRTVDDSCPYDVAGFSWAGFPGIAIGHNDDIAWGMTNLQADTTDLYLEKVTGKDYLYDDRQLPLEERDERIRIAGGDSKLITVRSTRHGPLVSDVSRELSSVGANAPAPTGAPDRGNGYAVAVDWTGVVAGHLDRRPAGDEPGGRLGCLPRGRRGPRRTGHEPRLRRQPRQHRLPGGRRRADPQGRPHRRLPGRGLEEVPGLDRQAGAGRRSCRPSSTRRPG